jgi:hypothetical protein
MMCVRWVMMGVRGVKKRVRGVINVGEMGAASVIARCVERWWPYGEKKSVTLVECVWNRCLCS